MATTTNFGWETPDDTDLVKDGAAAIRTLGQSIDTSMADLEGGTTGQVLSKASNADMDFTWITSDDANAIQNAIIDSKGDLIVGASADTPARFPIGSNGFVLTADSAETYGVKWAAAAASSGPAVSAYTSTAQTLTAATFTKIILNNELFDTDACFNTTNYRFTPTKAGKYQITAISGWTGAGTRMIAVIYKNGAAELYINDLTQSGFSATFNGSTLIDMNGSTDYLEYYFYSSGTPTSVTGTAYSRFTATWIRS